MGGSTVLTRYYSEEGTPPGRWLGSGLHAFGSGEIKRGDKAMPQQFALLLGTGRDPVTSEPLDRASPKCEAVRARVAARVSKLPRVLNDEEWREAAAMIAWEVAAGTRLAVVGHDFMADAVSRRSERNFRERPPGHDSQFEIVPSRNSKTLG